MKIVLMGTNSWVVPIFDALRQNHEIIAVFTRAPKPAGRKNILQKTPVEIWANALDLPVYNNINDYNFNPDFIVVASYGVILRDNVLGSAQTVNIHPSLLPKYRGPSPMLTALFNGDKKSGVCLMEMAAEVDAGDIYMCREFDIGEDDNNSDVENTDSKLSSVMLNEFLSEPNKYPKQKQIGNPTFTKKFTKEDLIIDWNKSATDIHNQIRSIGGKTKINGGDVKITKTKILNNGELEILKLTPAGKSEMDWKSFVNGCRGEIKIGE